MQEERVKDIEESLRDLLTRIESRVADMLGHESDGLYLLHLGRAVAPRFFSLLCVGAELESYWAYLDEKKERERTRGNDDDILF